MLFLGNSHTAANDLTGMVQRLLESDGTGRRVVVSVRSASFLGDFASQPQILREFRTGKWTHIVLQGTKMSSSHQYTYEQDTAIAVCKAAVSSGATTLLFPEWPRRGWNESDWILGHYRHLANQSGAKIVPVPKAWDEALAANPKIDLWAADGNHSNQTGAYLAACTFYSYLAGSAHQPAWRPNGMPKSLGLNLQRFARMAVSGGRRAPALPNPQVAATSLSTARR
jgi:hypothetical protein